MGESFGTVTRGGARCRGFIKDREVAFFVCVQFFFQFLCEQSFEKKDGSEMSLWKVLLSVSYKIKWERKEAV